MSAEVENNKDEEANNQAQQTKKTVKQHLQENWQLGLKILELLICIGCIGFAYEPVKVIGLGKTQLLHVGIMYTAYTGYILINVLMIFCKLIGDRLPYRTLSLFNFTGSIMFCLTTILLIIARTKLVQNYAFHPNTYRLTMLMTSIICAGINAIVFLIDGLFTLRERKEF